MKPVSVLSNLIDVSGVVTKLFYQFHNIQILKLEMAIIFVLQH